MTSLARDLRKDLEKTVKEARHIAEAGARKAVEQLGVGDGDAPKHLITADQRGLRNRLRAHGRQLGDRRDSKGGTQATSRLIQECAYEHWHRMLFARFLAETDLLIEPDSGVAITLDEVQELAREKSAEWLELASRYAERMLPQIFRAGDPVLDISLPPETRSELEDLLKKLPRDVFQADDSLGWVYQFWQAEKKDEVNKSETKIGADELPAVTQLFTEDYMVLFLLHNTLGAWWAGKILAARPELATSAKSEDELRAACKVGDVEWTYLRFVRAADDNGAEGPWSPAAGVFQDWPKAAKDVTVLDPCMGSGHFLVFALPVLAALRAAEESLSSESAIQAVLHDNLFGLEIDPRCTQIAAFNLALTAWRSVGHLILPAMHLACSGLSLGVTKVEWLKLAERAAAEQPTAPKSDLLSTEHNLFSDAMKRGFERLYDLFTRAPWIGSLIDPRGASGDLIEHGFVDLEPVLARVMAKADTAELAEMAVAAQGLAKAAEILARRFTLVVTNVPYLGRGKQHEILQDYCERMHPDAKADLATSFVDRCMKFCAAGGTTGLVTIQSWLFQGMYMELRKRLLKSSQWNTLAKLGPRAFGSIGGEIVNVCLISLTCSKPGKDHTFFGVDVTDERTAEEKADSLRVTQGAPVQQSLQLENPDARVSLGESTDFKLLQNYADSLKGFSTGDWFRFTQAFWEQPQIDRGWAAYQLGDDKVVAYGGRHQILLWEEGNGEMASSPGCYIKGAKAWGKRGVLVSQINLTATLYTGEIFHENAAAIIPKDDAHLTAIWAFLQSDAYREAVRGIDESLKVTNLTLAKIPFDLVRWMKIGTDIYPHGLPAPQSDDATQWLFSGHPKGCDAALQVAMSRLLGYRWPRQTGSSFPDCAALKPDGLETYGARDGIVTLSPVKGEQRGADRLTALLAEAFGSEWSAAKLDSMLAQVGFGSKTLDDWLIDGFFDQHCALFHQRPFIWHIWDGRRDGFQALVNYHRLTATGGEGRRTLEKLIYSYLGDWIDRQRADQKAGVEGADGRLAAAEHLRAELTKILEGEPLYDIFVRWKPLHEQPLGWEPDINDGVRMNVRPFMTARPLGAKTKGACILRTTPKIKWDKDRGKEQPRDKADYPWFWGWDETTQDFKGEKDFDGNRWNDLHYNRASKQAARDHHHAKARGKK